VLKEREKEGRKRKRERERERESEKKYTVTYGSFFFSMVDLTHQQSCVVVWL
jgi:hypothetical protein